MSRCSKCKSTEMCNVYNTKTCEYISDNGEYSYIDETEDFIHSTCDACGAVFATKMEELK